MHPDKRRVLCVEAHEDTCGLVTSLLEQSNYEVKGAKIVADALRLAQSQRFDLYLLSGMYEDGSGIELCEKIRAFDSRTPILFFSTYARESDRQQALIAGAQGYLVKPGNIFELSDTIARLFDQADVEQKSARSVERRRKPRIHEPFPATVYGMNASNEEFETRTTLKNFSAGGLYLRLAERVERGAKLSIVVRPSTAPMNEASAPCVAVNGVVLRAEPHRAGAYGLGIALYNADFFETWSWALRR